MDITVEGADRLAHTLRDAGRQLDTLDHTAAGQIIAQQAAQDAPRRTGHLASSHALVTTPGAVQVTNTARYAIPQHQGWAGHNGRPWLTHAAEATESAWLHTLDLEAQHALDTVQGA
ncbi:MAG: hypothetical protein QM708_07215 [Propioniciclava sp.]|uniref:hypothetical protein n=1 Tax=Propioniciclava sp. TaxID=2038686 RepID=UPI0039E5273F